jgi:hypothetical protein
MNSPIRQLQELGFSQYEAQAYVALLQRSPLNGYELARASGVPRANIYHVLDRLAERGAVLRLDAEEGARFAPILPDELIRGMRLRYQANLDEARQSLCYMQPEDAPSQVWNLAGYASLLDQAAFLAGSAQEELLLALRPEEAAALAASLENAESRGVDISILCLAACPRECGLCSGAVHRYHVSPDTDKRMFLLVKDRNELLAGEIGAGGDAQAVRTRQKLLVDLVTRSIQDSIALGAIVLDLGGRLEEILRPETRQVLASVGPWGDRSGWLENIQSLLKSQ